MVAFRLRKKNNSCITFQRITKRPLVINSDNASVNSVRPNVVNQNKYSPVHTSINIHSDSDRPRDIDLHLKTRLLIKSNKKFDYLKTALVTVLIFETLLFYIVYNKVTSNVKTMERLMYQTRSTVEDINMTKRKVDKLYKVLLNSYVKTVNRPDQIMRHIQKRDLSMIDVNNGAKSLTQNIKNGESPVVLSLVKNMKHVNGNESSAIALHSEDLSEEDRFGTVGLERNRNSTDVAQRAPRTVRASRRGKQSKCKTRDGCRHSRCRCRHKSGPLLAHLKGAIPEAVIRDGGSIIAPWFVDNTANGEYALANVLLQEGRGKVVIVEKGLYFIYAQVYYLTSSSLNSFSINVESEDEHSLNVIAMCSAEATTTKQSEVSCYTAVVRYLQPGDKIYITQRERNRRVVFRDGQTFLGITMLNSSPVIRK